MREDAQVATDLSDACLLWDIDGTLVVNAHPQRDRHSHAVRTVIDVDAQPVQLGTGKTDREIIAEIVSAHLEPADEVLDAALAALDEITAEDLAFAPSTPVAGVAEVLQWLSATSVQQRLLTGNTPRRADLKVSTAGLGHFFAGSEGFYGDRHLTRYALVAQAVEHFGPSGVARTVIIGDTPLDIAAARSGGFPVISVATGAVSAEVLAEHGPDALLADFNGGPDAFMAALETVLRA